MITKLEQDISARPTCRHCGERIVLARTMSGTLMALDAEPGKTPHHRMRVLFSGKEPAVRVAHLFDRNLRIPLYRYHGDFCTGKETK